jgi:hypothetical protein
LFSEDDDVKQKPLLSDFLDQHASVNALKKLTEPGDDDARLANRMRVRVAAAMLPPLTKAIASLWRPHRGEPFYTRLRVPALVGRASAL